MLTFYGIIIIYFYNRNLKIHFKNTLCKIICYCLSLIIYSIINLVIIFKLEQGRNIFIFISNKLCKK